MYIYIHIYIYIYIYMIYIYIYIYDICLHRNYYDFGPVLDDLAVKAFQADPFGALEQHLKNSIRPWSFEGFRVLGL